MTITLRVIPREAVEAMRAPGSGVKITRIEAQTPKAVEMRRYRARQKGAEFLAVLDMETDPFDRDNQEIILPFTACLYSKDFDPIVIWEEDFETFVAEIMRVLEELPHSYLIYAHNGGKFDFMFLIHKLRGSVLFKGRGIMKAQLGKHELRDSFHIIPERLASYAKDDFDYENMRKGKRQNYKQAIIDYMIADCRYLYDLVKGFNDEFGPKLSIGQAAMAEMKKTVKFERIGEALDAKLRPFYFGGRVECLQGRLHVHGHYKLYDVNSMYPDAMANYEHPLGNNYTWRIGAPGQFTAFVDLTCRNHGALVARRGQGAEQETTTAVEFGRFYTTIHEYKMALKLGLIEDVEIHYSVDCNKFGNFASFIVPMYLRRQEFKKELKAFALRGDTSSFAYLDMKKNDMFMKFLLNNSYGKFAQNPRKYKETFYTAPGEFPDEPEAYGPIPVARCEHYWIWERPTPSEKFNNVGTAASITGAARAKLMEAIANADDAIYCDTDSLICRELHNTELHPTDLGAWDLEAEFSEVIINGKKLYACKPLDGTKPKVKSKGAAQMTYDEMLRVYNDDVVKVTAFGPTIVRTGQQSYMTRRIQATVKKREEIHASSYERLAHQLRAR